MKSSVYQEINPKQLSKASASWLGTLTLTGLLSTILLIMVGSFVRVSGNGLGCPDWPLCYGQAVPPLGDMSAWIEFSHRLLGGIVGLQIAAVILLAWRHYRDNKLIWRTAVASGFVLIIQVSLGGFHVLNELPRWTGLIHTAVAMTIAGLLAALVAVTQPKFQALAQERLALFGQTRLKVGAAVGAAATYLLLLTGSLVTRTGASLACPSFPHCGVADIPESLAGLVTIQLIHRFTGSRVTRFRPGDGVFGTCQGSCAEYVSTSEATLVSKPGDLTFVEAAALPTSGLAALHALRDVGKVQPGQKILINGASGGVGTFAVQIAKSLGESARHVGHRPPGTLLPVDSRGSIDYSPGTQASDRASRSIRPVPFQRYHEQVREAPRRSSNDIAPDAATRD
jgi:hypothetical protein